jgi:hypothetical protein
MLPVALLQEAGKMADGMFMTPQMARQAAIQAGMISPQQMGSQGLLQQVISTMANAGTGVGAGIGGLFGAEYAPERQARMTQEVLQAAGRYSDPVVQAKEAYKLFQAQGMPMQAQAMMERAMTLEQQRKQLAQEEALNQARVDYYTGKATSGTGTSAGTGTERMIQYVGDIRRRLLQGQPVEQWEYDQANDYMSQLGKQKSYTDPSGRIITISQAQITPLPPLPGEKATGTAEEKAAQVLGGARVTETPQAQDVKQKKNIQETLRTEQINDNLTTIKDATNLVGGWTTGVGSWLKVLPSSDAKNLESKLTTIKSNLGFDRLQQMRDASPTGGALGQVAVQELEALQASVASLDQELSPAALRANLAKVQKHYQNWLDIVRGGTPLPPPTEEQPQMKPTYRFNKETGKLEKL